MALSKIQAESMNLADTYAFTGTVSGAGKVLQVQKGELTSGVTSSSTSFSTGDTGLSVTITPLSASSNLMVYCPLTVGNSYSSYNNNYWTIWRDGTAVTTDGSGYGSTQLNTGSGRYFSYIGRLVPANNTNSTTFNLRFAMDGGTTIYTYAGVQLIAMEIAT